MDVDGRVTLLRRVDGYPHVVLGPLLLAGLTPVGRVTGASRGTLAAILVPFTAYGILVVAGTRNPDEPPQWLVPLAVMANAAAVVVGSAAVMRRGLTPLGRLGGGGLAVGGVRLLLALRGPRT